MVKTFDRFCLPEIIESLPRKNDKATIDLKRLSVGDLFTMAERPLFYKAAEALKQKLAGKDEEILLQNGSRYISGQICARMLLGLLLE